jgi:hypothetical protein
MDLLREIANGVLDIVPTAVAVAAVAIVLFVVHRLLERTRGPAEFSSFRNQLIMLGLTFVGGLLVILVLPIGEATRGQLLSLIGILFSAAIALSSTTILGNALAGPDAPSDSELPHGRFHSGRRTLRAGLGPRSVPHRDTDAVPRGVERLMLEAAGKCGLEDPFVHVEELGDCSVTYRVAGLLKDVKRLITARSDLRERVMDALHRGGVEIVSPTFMNQRVFTPDSRFIPEVAMEGPMAEESAPEEVVFDKAEAAESQEALQFRHDEVTEQIKSLRERIKKSEDEAEKKELELQRERLETRRDHLARVIEAAKSSPREEKG